MKNEPTPQPLEKKVEDLPEDAKKLFLSMIDHLVMDTPFSAKLADSFPDLPIEDRKKRIQELVDAGYIKAQLNDEQTGYRWVIWENGKYRPFS